MIGWERGLLGCLLGIAWVLADAASLYDEATYTPLVSDARSFRVGQIVTVLIYEQASAATSADTETSRSVDLEGTIRGNANEYAGSAAFAHGAEGGGTITRSGKLVASVSVTINEILDTGEFQVAGEQLIEFNDEKQHIKLEGRVRSQDIRADNTVVSTRLANAKITYVGDGILGAQQKPGYITRFLNWLFG